MNFDLTYSCMLPVLKYFAQATHSWGWAIVGLTCLVRILVAPLVTSSTLQMRKMSQLQPQVQAIQTKYKAEPEMLQKKLMEFYKKNKMNPMGGCLPMLVQLPILFALYGTFSGPPYMDKAIDVPIKVVAPEKAGDQKRDQVSKATCPYVAPNGDLSKIVVFPGETVLPQGQTIDFGTRAAEGKLDGELKCKWKLIPKSLPKDLPADLPKDFPRTTDPNKIDVAAVDTQFHATFPLPGDYIIQAKVPAIASNDPFLFIGSLGKVAKGLDLLKPQNWDILFLIIAFGGTTYLSSLFSVSGGPKVPDEEMTEQQLIQKQTMKMMPITMTAMFCFIPLPAGVFLYFVISNLFQVIQTWILMKQPAPAVVSVMDDDGSGGSGGSGVKRPGGPKDSGAGRSKGPSTGKSTGPSGGSPATISSIGSDRDRVAATSGSGATLNTKDNRESVPVSDENRKTKKKKK